MNFIFYNANDINDAQKWWIPEDKKVVKDSIPVYTLDLIQSVNQMNLHIPKWVDCAQENDFEQLENAYFGDINDLI